MSGIQMALLGVGPGGPVVSVGQTTVTVKVTFYYYGYNGSVSASIANIGSITGATFNGATVKAIYSGSSGADPAGKAIQYTVWFSGNRSAGFFNTLTVNGTLVTGTLSSPTYNATNDETSFTITLASSADTLFGTTNGVLIPTILT